MPSALVPILRCIVLLLLCVFWFMFACVSFSIHILGFTASYTLCVITLGSKLCGTLPPYQTLAFLYMDLYGYGFFILDMVEIQSAQWPFARVMCPVCCSALPSAVLVPLSSPWLWHSTLQVWHLFGVCNTCSPLRVCVGRGADLGVGVPTTRCTCAPARRTFTLE